jgi:hypothetical protein
MAYIRFIRASCCHWVRAHIIDSIIRARFCRSLFAIAGLQNITEAKKLVSLAFAGLNLSLPCGTCTVIFATIPHPIDEKNARTFYVLILHMTIH